MRNLYGHLAGLSGIKDSLAAATVLTRSAIPATNQCAARRGRREISFRPTQVEAGAAGLPGSGVAENRPLEQRKSKNSPRAVRADVDSSCCHRRGPRALMRAPVFSK